MPPGSREETGCRLSCAGTTRSRLNRPFCRGRSCTPAQRARPQPPAVSPVTGPSADDRTTAVDFLRPPGTVSLLVIGYDFSNEGDIFSHLEIIHPDVHEIGAQPESQVEAL